MWTTLDGTWGLARYDPRTNATVLFPFGARPGAEPALWALRIAANGDLWTLGPDAFYRLDPATGNVTRWATGIPNLVAGDVWLAPDGKVWGALVAAERVVRLDPATGEISAYPMPRAPFGPLHFADAGSGGPWLSSTYGGTWARLDPATGAVTPGRYDALVSPTGIVAQGNVLWMGEHGADSIARVDPATGKVERFPTTPSPFYPSSGPSGVAVASDGKVWFVEHFADRIARLDPVAGTLAEIQVPSAPGTNMQRVALDAQGRAWWAEWSKNRVGSATIDADAPGFTVPSRVSVRSGEGVRFTVSGLTGALSAHVGDPLLVAKTEGNDVLLEPGKAPLGEYRVLVSEKIGAGWLGRYVTLVVEEADMPVPWLLAVAALAVAAWRRR